MSRIVYGTKLHTADLNDSFCEITSLNRVNASIFGASGSNQTTTGSIATGSSILTLSSPIDFANGQGIRIDGAGTDGDGTRLIATIIAGAGSTTLILSKPADTSVTAANVWHDDTAAIQSAINFLAANGGGQVDFGAGQFNLGGAPQRPSTVNAILTLPMIALGSDISIGFRGTAAIGITGRTCRTFRQPTEPCFSFPTPAQAPMPTLSPVSRRRSSTTIRLPGLAG
jgi:hypothetical protein